jgi:colanic acid/amylovoran biosynthesis glycosyltransferase
MTPLNRDMMLYLDTRMGPSLFASPEDMRRRRSRIKEGAPLRLINSGRLEPMKGAQDLVPIAGALRGKGLDFTLDIYGEGSLRNEIAHSIRDQGLGQSVFLHDPVDFESELVPICRTNADIFLSCHRQSDPSCTYLESMGCGLPVLGYRNRMLTGLLETVDAGWAVPLGDISAITEKIAALDKSRDEIAQCADRAAAFSQAHGFREEFRKRMHHLAALAA